MLKSYGSWKAFNKWVSGIVVNYSFVNWTFLCLGESPRCKLSKCVFRICCILLLTGLRSVFFFFFATYDKFTYFVWLLIVLNQGRVDSLFQESLYILWSFLKNSMCVIQTHKNKHLFLVKKKAWLASCDFLRIG